MSRMRKVGKWIPVLTVGAMLLAMLYQFARLPFGYRVGPPIQVERANPLWEAIRSGGNFNDVRRLLDERPDAAREEINGATFLYCAVANNREDVAELLLQRGADPNARVAKDWAGAGQTPVVAAVQNRNVRVLRLLIRGGADLNARAQFGQTLTELAVGWPEGELILKNAGQKGVTQSSQAK